MHDNNDIGQRDEEKTSHLKRIIVDNAKRGVFDNNPLLSTVHFVTCKKCKYRQSIIYLDYFKSGEFDFGKGEQIEVLNSHGPISFLEMEKVTPIIIGLNCKRCGYHMEVRPINTEYLQVIIARPKVSGTMYV